MTGVMALCLLVGVFALVAAVAMAIAEATLLRMGGEHNEQRDVQQQVE